MSGKKIYGGEDRAPETEVFKIVNIKQGKVLILEIPEKSEVFWVQIFCLGAF